MTRERQRSPRRSYAETAVLLVGTLLLFAWVPAAFAQNVNPHGGVSAITEKCQTCHAPHDAQGQLLLFPRGETVDEFCYTCHDGTGSAFNVRMAFDRFPSALTSHPVDAGLMSCTDCHTPHEGPEEGNSRSLAVGPTRESVGNVVCGTCHGPTGSAAGGDILTRYTGSTHDTAMPDPPSGTGIKCVMCHLPHSSDNVGLLREVIVGASGTTHTAEATAGAGSRPVCEACHDVATILWRGPAEYEKTAHRLVTTSTLAAVVPTLSLESTITTGTWPPAGDCSNCHEAHGTGQPFMIRAAGDRLCTSCHDAAGTTKPPSHSYQGYTVMQASPHAALTKSRTGSTQAAGCNVCHAVHGGGAQSVDATSPAGLLWRYEGELCTGSGTGGCHAEPENASGGTDVLAAFEASSSPSTHHDVMPADQNATGARLACSGCHNPHTEKATAVYSDPDSVGATMSVGFSEYVGSNGEVFALVGAEHDAVAPVVPESSVVATSVAGTMTIRWTTNEAATSRVQWGTSTLYENGVTGTATLTAEHSVELTPAAVGTDHHFRIRTADALGNEFVSRDYVFNLGVTISGPPVLNELIDVSSSSSSGRTVPLSWAPVTVSDGHAPEYYVEVRRGATLVGTSGWITTTSWTTPRLSLSSYTWQVWARDPQHVNASSVSAVDSFSVSYWEAFNPTTWFAALRGLFYPAGRLGSRDVPGTRVAVAEPSAHFSVDTDLISIETRSRTAASSTYSALAGWQSLGGLATQPTPSSPGVAAGGSALASAGSLDDNYWATDLATGDREWNWQVSRFDISATQDRATELSIRWEGHGEPTTGYATRLYLWNRVTGMWTQVYSATALGSDRLVITAPISSIGDGFCLRCHDAAQPEGTVMKPGVTNIAATWGAAAPSDFHGPRAGTGPSVSTGGLAVGYARGASVACATCHDPHGTTNPFIFAERVNGVVTAGLAGTNQVSELCHACHTGATTQWHAGCISCHEGLVDDPDHGDPNVNFSDSAVCRDCHRHGSETKWGTVGIVGAPGCTRGAAHSAGCHTWATTF